MFSLERWQEIFETLNKNRLRTFLTALSVASGIFILVILLGVSTGIQNGVQSEFEQDATNRISVWTGVTTKEYKGLNPGRYIQLKNEDFNLISSKVFDYNKIYHFLVKRLLISSLPVKVLLFVSSLI